MSPELEFLNYHHLRYFHAVAQGCISITPLQVDLTDHARRADWSARLGSA
jgi:broad specificity polyphosphatase/5'/3'-nucleotidase SurE